MSIGRLFRTVRHLKPTQIWFQVWRRLQKKFEPHPKCGSEELPEFTFLNVTARPKGWNDESLELLWRYNLHYFDYVNGRVEHVEKEWENGRVEVEKWRNLMERWIAENPHGAFPGWEPYPTSLRIVNWVKWLSSNNSQLTTHDLQLIEFSLNAQSSWLMSHLEYHLLANHLLANAKALVFAGKYLVRRDLYEKGMSVYRRQLPEQTCSDGVNFERSPMYHAIIFEDMLDLAEYTDEPLFKEYVARMAEGMMLLTGTDGKIAKFNDSTEGIARQPTELLARAEKLVRVEVEKGGGKGVVVGSCSCRVGSCSCGKEDSVRSRTTTKGYDSNSGFLRQECGNYVLLAKCGEIGPSYQPGHAHADTYSFELWKSGKKVVGDTGCSTYIPGDVRSYERSTMAHNTVVIDAQNSSEVWSSHRVGRRFDRESHRREFTLSADGLKGVDSLGGNGEHRVEVRFHIPPGVPKNEVTIDCPGELRWEECEFAEGWNVRKKGFCAVYSSRLDFPAKIEWCIR